MVPFIAAIWKVSCIVARHRARIAAIVALLVYSITYHYFDCIAERLASAVVGVTNTSWSVTAPRLSNVAVCGVTPSQAVNLYVKSKPSNVVHCPPVLPPARYLAVLISVPYLTICEILVYGCPGRRYRVLYVVSGLTFNSNATFRTVEQLNRVWRYKCGVIIRVALLRKDK